MGTIFTNKILPQQRFMILCGAFFVILGVLLSEPIMASLTEDGEIGIPAARIALWVGSIFLILAGISAILFRHSKTLFRLVIMSIVFVFMVTVLDYGMYLAAPLLPASTVRLMSPHAQLRYFEAHQDDIHLIGMVQNPEKLD